MFVLLKIILGIGLMASSPYVREFSNNNSYSLLGIGGNITFYLSLMLFFHSTKCQIRIGVHEQPIVHVLVGIEPVPFSATRTLGD